MVEVGDKELLWDKILNAFEFQSHDVIYHLIKRFIIKDTRKLFKNLLIYLKLSITEF